MAVNIVTGMTGEPHITSDDDRIRNAAAFGKGKFIFGTGNSMSADIVDDNTIRINSGMAINQGTQMGIEIGDYEDLLIDNGTLGFMRKDLIVLRYNKVLATGIEEATLEVIKGTPSASNPQTPAYISGDILTGEALQDDMPLYEVDIDGVSITGLTRIAEVKPITSGGGDASNKMDKDNPTGTGALSINRKAGTDVGSASVVAGIDNEASENYAVALGDRNRAADAGAVALGGNNQATAQCSAAIGESNVAGGRASAAIGSHNIANAVIGQVVVGKYNQASNDNLFAVGIGTDTDHRKNGLEVSNYGDVHIAHEAKIDHALSLGRKAGTDVESGSATLGYNNEASEYYAVAIGESNKSKDVASITIGADNESAYGSAVAIGKGTKTGLAGQVVVGKYNQANNGAVFVVGNGTADNARSTAFSVDASGNAHVLNDVYDGNGNLSTAIAQLRADVDYIAMMTGVILVEEEEEE